MLNLSIFKKFTSFALLVALVFSSFYVSISKAATLLSDDFTGTTIDTNKWQ